MPPEVKMYLFWVSVIVVGIIGAITVVLIEKQGKKKD